MAADIGKACTTNQIPVLIAGGRYGGAKLSCTSQPTEADLLLDTLGLRGELETSITLACYRVRKSFGAVLLAWVVTPQA